MKKIAILPTLMTLGNGVCGFAAIVYVPQSELQRAGTALNAR